MFDPRIQGMPEQRMAEGVDEASRIDSLRVRAGDFVAGIVDRLGDSVDSARERMQGAAVSVANTASKYGAPVLAATVLAVTVGNVTPATAERVPTDNTEENDRIPGCVPASSSTKPRAKVSMVPRPTKAGDDSGYHYENLVDVDHANKTMNVTSTVSLPKAGGGQRTKSATTKTLACLRNDVLFMQGVRSSGTETVPGQRYKVAVTARHRGKKVVLSSKQFPLRGNGTKATFEDFEERSWTILKRQQGK